jgi:gamma-glutamylcyclotransferase (GGCT)/AIG2-like uncharacterized protein YtfP
MENLFAYGSLRKKKYKKLFWTNTKRSSRKIIRIRVKRIEEEFGLENYPIITPTEDDSDCIEGIVYELTVEELQLSDTMKGTLGFRSH